MNELRHLHALLPLPGDQCTWMGKLKAKTAQVQAYSAHLRGWRPSGYGGGAAAPVADGAETQQPGSAGGPGAVLLAGAQGAQPGVQGRSGGTVEGRKAPAGREGQLQICPVISCFSCKTYQDGTCQESAGRYAESVPADEAFEAGNRPVSSTMARQRSARGPCQPLRGLQRHHKEIVEYCTVQHRSRAPEQVRCTRLQLLSPR